MREGVKNMKWLNTWDSNKFPATTKKEGFSLSSAIWQEPETCKNRNRTYSSWKVKRNKYYKNKDFYMLEWQTQYLKKLFYFPFLPTDNYTNLAVFPDQHLLFRSHVPWSWVVVLLRCIPWPLWYSSLCVPICCHLPLASFL